MTQESFAGPVAQLVATMEESLARIDALREHVADHYGTDPEEVNYGHVGSAKRIDALLRELCEFAGVKP